MLLFAFTFAFNRQVEVCVLLFLNSHFFKNDMQGLLIVIAQTAADHEVTRKQIEEESLLFKLKIRNTGVGR